MNYSNAFTTDLLKPEHRFSQGYRVQICKLVVEEYWNLILRLTTANPDSEAEPARFTFMPIYLKLWNVHLSMHPP